MDGGSDGGVGEVGVGFWEGWVSAFVGGFGFVVIVEGVVVVGMGDKVVLVEWGVGLVVVGVILVLGFGRVVGGGLGWELGLEKGGMGVVVDVVYKDSLNRWESNFEGRVGG